MGFCCFHRVIYVFHGVFVFFLGGGGGSWGFAVFNSISNVFIRFSWGFMGFSYGFARFSGVGFGNVWVICHTFQPFVQRPSLAL